MNSAAYSHLQEEGEARTGVSQKDVKARRRSVMDIFHDSFHHEPSHAAHINEPSSAAHINELSSSGHINELSSAGHTNRGNDYFPVNDFRLDSLSCGFSTHPEPTDNVTPCKGAEGRTSKPPKPAQLRKSAAAPANPWGLIFKNREHFVEIHLR